MDIDVTIEILTDSRAQVQIRHLGVTRTHLMHARELAMLVTVAHRGGAGDVDHPLVAVVLTNLVQRGLIYDARHVDDGSDTQETADRVIDTAKANHPLALAVLTQPRAKDSTVRKTAFFGVVLTAVGVVVCQTVERERARYHPAPASTVAEA